MKRMRRAGFLALVGTSALAGASALAGCAGIATSLTENERFHRVLELPERLDLALLGAGQPMAHEYPESAISPMFRQNGFRNLSKKSQRVARRIIAKHIHERFNELALINLHELARFTLEKPNAHIRHAFERRTEPALAAPRSSRNAPHSSHASGQKTDQSVGLAERITLQNNGFRFAKWHPACRRADYSARIANSKRCGRTKLLSHARKARNRHIAIFLAAALFLAEPRFPFAHFSITVHVCAAQRKVRQNCRCCRCRDQCHRYGNSVAALPGI